MRRETISAKNAPAAVGPYVHAVLAGDMLFTSGQLGLEPVTGASGGRGGSGGSGD